MTGEKQPDRSTGEAWDRLFDEVEPLPTLESEGPDDVEDTVDRPGLLPVIASAWADLVVIGAMTTAAIGAIAALGYSVSLPALPWAAAVAVLWWVTTSVVLVRVRRATPGMVIAGLTFGDPVAGWRVAAVLAAATVSAALLGLPLLFGSASWSLLAAAAGSRITTLTSDV